MINQNLTEKIIDYGMSYGGDFVEIFMEDTDSTQLTLLGNEVVKSVSGKLAGTGIRIFRGDESIYLHTAGEGEAELLELMKRWKQTNNMKPQEPLEDMHPCLHDQPKRILETAMLKDKLDILKRCNQAGSGTHKAIMQMRTNYVDVDQEIRIINSEGLNISDHRVKTRILIIAYAKDGTEIQSSYAGPGAMQGFEFYEMINPETYAVQAAREAVNRLGARFCPTGRLPVVIGNGFGGLFFHEACGHSMEACSVIDGASEFSGKIGQTVASSKVTLIDDGSIPGEWGSLKVDDEGNPTRENILIENGILKGYLTDRLSGRRLGILPTGSGRRENYCYPPTSRMTNTFILPGKDKPEDIIASIQKGIYVKNIGGGSVNSTTGQFNFNTNGAFLIENGEITVPLHSASLIGTGSDILKKIEMVGTDYRIGQGYCYAASGTIFIGAGQPTVKISEMTVGGDRVC